MFAHATLMVSTLIGSSFHGLIDKSTTWIGTNVVVDVLARESCDGFM